MFTVVFFTNQEADIDKAKDDDTVQAENAVDVTSSMDFGSEAPKVDANGPSSVVAQAVAQTRQEMPGILEVLKAGKFQVRWILGFKFCISCIHALKKRHHHSLKRYIVFQ